MELIANTVYALGSVFLVCLMIPASMMMKIFFQKRFEERYVHDLKRDYHEAKRHRDALHKRNQLNDWNFSDMRALLLPGRQIDESSQVMVRLIDTDELLNPKYIKSGYLDLQRRLDLSNFGYYYEDVNGDFFFSYSKNPKICELSVVQDREIALILDMISKFDNPTTSNTKKRGSVVI